MLKVKQTISLLSSLNIPAEMTWAIATNNDDVICWECKEAKFLTHRFCLYESDVSFIAARRPRCKAKSDVAFQLMERGKMVRMYFLKELIRVWLLWKSPWEEYSASPKQYLRVVQRTSPPMDLERCRSEQKSFREEVQNISGNLLLASHNLASARQTKGENSARKNKK